MALSDFSKKLEEYFQTFDNGKKLYYERRYCQYNSMPGIEKTRIIIPGNLIRAYASMFLDEPHRTTRNFRALRALIGKEIYAADHKLEPYYLAGISLYRLEYLFRNQSLDAKYKPARWHTLLAFRLLASPGPIPKPNSRDMVKFCEPLIDRVWDTADAQELFARATQAVHAVAKGDFHRDRIRTLPFTKELKNYCEQVSKKKKVRMRR